MAERTDFEFVTVACRDPKANNCPQVAVNIAGVVAVRDSARPDEVVTFTPDDWTALVVQQAQQGGLSA
ncbi:DUF397 domain-containing protein [Kitasatospora sp. NPDC088351]|uniref:DUF397 domain-containing protein n=1 Tax=Kitasatospora sp. NPDC088351 TaxID=3155180 RepID=UPI003428DF54